MIRRLLRDYFSLTRSERRGLQLMGSLVFLLAAIRLVIPYVCDLVPVKDPVADEDLLAFFDYLESRPEKVFSGHSSELLPEGDHREPGHSGGGPAIRYDTRRERSLPPVLKPFDPNAAGLEELLSLGIPERTSRTLIRYRDAGGRFGHDSDLLKVYGMDSLLYFRLLPYIRIAADTDPGGRTSWKQPAAFGLNEGDSAQLMDIYGIGPVFSTRIIRYREYLGGFYDHSQLEEVYGISGEQCREIESRTYIDTGRLRRFDLNRVSIDSLAAHPYLTRYQASSLVEYRQIMGSYSSLDEVHENMLLPDSVFSRIRPYLFVSD